MAAPACAEPDDACACGDCAMTFPATSIVMARAAVRVPDVLRKDGFRKEEKLCGFIGSRLYSFCFAEPRPDTVFCGGALKPCHVERRDARTIASRSRNIPRTLTAPRQLQGILPRLSFHLPLAKNKLKPDFNRSFIMSSQMSAAVSPAPKITIASAGHRVPAIDVLRGLCILGVVLHHINIRIPFKNSALRAGSHLP